MRWMLVLSMATLASAGFAATTFYTVEAEWNSQLTNLAYFDFEGIGTEDGAISFGEGPLTVGPASFFTDFATLFWIGKDFGGTPVGYFNNAYACASAQQQATKMTVTLDAPVRAFGMVYNNFDGFGGHISLDNGAGTDYLCDGLGTQNFFGFVSDDEVSGFEVSFLPASGLNVARFDTGTPNPVPEPATAALIGLAIPALLRRKGR